MTGNATDQANMSADVLLTLDEALQFLGISRPTLYRWLAQGEITGLKAGKQWRFRKADLQAYVARDPLADSDAPEPLVAAEVAALKEAQPTTAAAQTVDQEIETPHGIEAVFHAICDLAFASNASDIHLEPVRLADRSDYWLRMRVDGTLQEIRRIPNALHASLNLCIKQAANLDLVERKIPQEGGIPYTHDGKSFVLTVATLPTLHGESITVRIQEKERMLMSLETIGIPQDHPLRTWIGSASGLILFSGPTGSGKTTTIYSCLNEISRPERKTFAVAETLDAVIPNTTAVIVNERAGLGYGPALRSIWQHDPDVLFIGDGAVAEAARALPAFALTGHLVLAQLQAGSAAAAAVHLVNCGAEQFAVAMSLTGILSQCLARKICAECKKPVSMAASHPLLVSAWELAKRGGLEMPAEFALSRGRGCDRCRNTGYRGRIPLYEAMEWSQSLVEAMQRRASVEELEEIAVSQGMITIGAAGVAKALAGETTLEEVFRVCASRTQAIL